MRDSSLSRTRRQLAAFCAVGETLSFTKAAEMLGTAQSSVTVLVQGLEREFNVALFERLGKRVRLTEAGSRLLIYAQQLLALTDEIRAALPGDGAPAGTLTIGTPETVCAYRLPPVLHRFRERYPGVQLVFRAGISTSLRNDIIEGRLDLAFVLDRPVPSPAIVTEPLTRERVLLLAHPGHPLAARKLLHPADLNGEPIVVTEAGGSYRTAFENALADEGARAGTTIEFASVEAIKQCVIAGVGLTVLPAVTVETDLRERRLVGLEWTGPNLDVMTQMIWHKDKYLSPALVAFQEVTRETLTASRASET